MMMLVAAVTFNITFDFVNNRVNDRMIYLREREESLDKFSMISREVRANFNGVIDEVYLMESVARGFLAGIGDPFAVYHDVRSFQSIQQAQASPVAGIGALLRANPEGDGYIYVEEVLPDSPALAAGIQPGDLIIRVDDEDLAPANSVSMLENISGEQGSRVTLTIRSDNVDRDEELIRRIVPVPSVESRMIDGTRVGYIIISDLNQHTPDQFRRERDRLIGVGATSLIFDVRDLEGGELVYLSRVLDTLIPAGPIVSSRDKNGVDSVMFTANGPGIEIPMVTLQNAGTTGPAELFVQVLADYNRARSVGTLSAGRGVLQEIIPLVDGSAIELTVALLVSPGGTIFHGVGVQPHYEVTFDGEWRELDENLDPQLRRGIDLAQALELAWGAQAEAEAAAAEIEDNDDQPEELPIN
ncbi:MAG: S41 family peptidase [Oscillospiraceae bacterium]|nr:S41 family peptidase [Oscillospiraceae bacterium]